MATAQGLARVNAINATIASQGQAAPNPTAGKNAVTSGGGGAVTATNIPGGNPHDAIGYDPTKDPTSSVYNQSINSKNLSLSPTIPLATPPATQDYSSILNQAVGMASQNPTEQSVQQSQTDLFTKYLASQKAPPDLASIQTKLERDNQIQQKQALKNQYQAQLNSIVNQAQADVLATQGQGRGIPEAIIGGQQAQIQKEAAIKALPVQALLSAAQNDLETAQSHVDKMFQIYAKDAENQVNYYNRQSDLVYNFLDKQQQQQLDTIKQDKQFQQQILIKNLDAQQTYANEALKKGNVRLFNAITSVKPPTDLNSPTYKTDLATYQKDLTTAITKYGGAGTIGNGGNLSANALAVIDNPNLLNTYTSTMKQKVIAELQNAGYDTTTLGTKPLSDTAIKEINQTNTALTSLNDLRVIISSNQDKLGPITGLAALNPWSESRKIQANIDRVKQQVGKALEGGVLRKEDEEKYKKILATITDTPSTALYKLDALTQSLIQSINDYKALQTGAGRSANVTGSLNKKGTEVFDRNKARAELNY